MPRLRDAQTRVVGRWSERISLQQAQALALCYATGDAARRRHVVAELVSQVPSCVVDREIESLRLEEPVRHAHARLVGLYASGIARSLGLSPPTARLIRQAAALHDLGKLGIPRALLERPSALTPSEYELVKLHPQLGLKMLEPYADLGATRPLILHHHERYDGGGYPFGLEGDRIPLGARVIAIADSIDAMRSVRSYKPAYSSERVRAELVAGSGTQYDPVVVDATLSWMNDRPNLLRRPRCGLKSRVADAVGHRLCPTPSGCPTP